MKINCSRSVHSVHIYKDLNMIPVLRAKRGSMPFGFSDTALISRRKRETSDHGN